MEGIERAARRASRERVRPPPGRRPSMDRLPGARGGHRGSRDSLGASARRRSRDDLGEQKKRPHRRASRERQRRKSVESHQRLEQGREKMRVDLSEMAAVARDSGAVDDSPLGDAVVGDGRPGVTDAVMANVCHMAKDQLRADIVTIFLFAPKKRQLWSRWGTNLPADITTGKRKPIRVPAHAGIAGKCFTQSALVNVPDASGAAYVRLPPRRASRAAVDTRGVHRPDALTTNGARYRVAFFNKNVDKHTGYVTRSVLGLPIYRPPDASGKQDPRPLGVVQFINKLADEDDADTDDDDGAALEALGAAAGVNLGAAADDEDLRLDQKKVEAEVLHVARGMGPREAIRVVAFEPHDEDLAQGFGKIAGRAIATAIEHDEHAALEARRREDRKLREQKANFESHVEPGAELDPSTWLQHVSSMDPRRASRVESIFDFFDSKLQYQEKAEAPSQLGLEEAHDERVRAQREGELSVKMNAMIRGYLTRRTFEKRMRKTGLVASGISESARSHAENVLSQIKAAERVRRQALAQQQSTRKEILRDVARAIQATNDALRAGAERAYLKADAQLAKTAAAIAADAERLRSYAAAEMRRRRALQQLADDAEAAAQAAMKAQRDRDIARFRLQRRLQVAASILVQAQARRRFCVDRYYDRLAAFNRARQATIVRKRKQRSSLNQVMAIVRFRRRSKALTEAPLLEQRTRDDDWRGVMTWQAVVRGVLVRHKRPPTPVESGPRPGLVTCQAAARGYLTRRPYGLRFVRFHSSKAPQISLREKRRRERERELAREAERRWGQDPRGSLNLEAEPSRGGQDPRSVVDALPSRAITKVNAAVIAARRGEFNPDVTPSRFGGPLDILEENDKRFGGHNSRTQGPATGKTGRYATKLLAALRAEVLAEEDPLPPRKSWAESTLLEPETWKESDSDSDPGGAFLTEAPRRRRRRYIDVGVHLPLDSKEPPPVEPRRPERPQVRRTRSAAYKCAWRRVRALVLLNARLAALYSPAERAATESDPLPIPPAPPRTQ